MTQKKLRVAIIGCGRLGQHYAEAYQTYPDTEIVAIAEYNPDRLKAVGERFGVKALFPDAGSMVKEVVPDIAAVVLPGKFIKDAVIACARAGVKGISTDKPIAATLSDADEMVEECARRGVVFAGGNLMVARHEVQEAAARLRDGVYGTVLGAAVHGFALEISGGGCQHITLLRTAVNADIEEVVAWGMPEDAVQGDDDGQIVINGRLRMSNGLIVPVFGQQTPGWGVSVWTDTTLVRFPGATPPEIYHGFDSHGARVKIDPDFAPYEWSEFSYLTGSIRSFLASVETGGKLWISGDDLRNALEVAVAARQSARLGSAPVRLPLADRSLTLYPVPYRWLGGDSSGRPQAVEEVFSNRARQ